MWRPPVRKSTRQKRVNDILSPRKCHFGLSMTCVVGWTPCSWESTSRRFERARYLAKSGWGKGQAGHGSGCTFLGNGWMHTRCRCCMYTMPNRAEDVIVHFLEAFQMFNSYLTSLATNFTNGLKQSCSGVLSSLLHTLCSG